MDTIGFKAAYGSLENEVAANLGSTIQVTFNDGSLSFWGEDGETRLFKVL